MNQKTKLRSITIICLVIILQSFGCNPDVDIADKKFSIPRFTHDLSHHPYDATLDKPDFVVCDSTKIGSGRNRLQYLGGNNKLRQDILSKYQLDSMYESFNGLIIIRFIFNCEGKIGRFRVQAVDEAFEPLKAPQKLLDHSLDLISDLNTWVASSSNKPNAEYSKFIKLKFNDGKIEHVLL